MHLYQFYKFFTLPQAATCRNRSCIQSSNPSLVVVLITLRATARMMTMLQTFMASRRQCFTLHHHHRRRRHRPWQTRLTMVMVITSLVHRLSAYRLPVLARGRPRLVAVPRSDMLIIYVWLIIYVSFRLFTAMSQYLCMRHASSMCYYRTCFYVIRRHILFYVCGRHIIINSHSYSSYISK